MSFKINSLASIKDTSEQGAEAIPTKVGKAVFVKASELFKKYKPYYANRGEGPDGMDMARVTKIAKSIIGSEAIGSNYNGTYWLVNPIIVNAKTRMIVDGHYTAAALNKVLELTGWDLDTIVIEREFPRGIKDMTVVSMFNNSRKSWCAEQYIECYIKEGVPDYIKLKEAALKLGGPFVKKNGKPVYRYVSALVGKSGANALRKGEFKFDPVIIERGERVKQLFYAISSTKQTSTWFESFIFAYCDQEENNRKAFKVFMQHADELVIDGCTAKEGWNEQFNKIWDKVL